MKSVLNRFFRGVSSRESMCRDTIRRDITGLDAYIPHIPFFCQNKIGILIIIREILYEKGVEYILQN